MIIDHLGVFFFPDQEGWRVVGRMSMPIWMFLVGYAQTRKIPDMLYWGAGILFISDFVFGQNLFALSILVTIIIIRYTLDYIMAFALSGFQNLFMATFSLIILAFPTMFLFEYGTQAVLFAMFGYLLRHQKKIEWSNEKIMIFMFVSFMAYMAFQKIVISFNTVEFYTMGAGVLLVCLSLMLFQPKLYPELTKKWPTFISEFFKVMGRQTLEIYVIHLILFKMAGFWLFPERFGLFEFTLF